VRLGILMAIEARETGQDVVEYGLLMATLAILVLVGSLTFGDQIRPWFDSLAARIATVGT
jgi:Flp pilus assembly pilin Flp